MSETTWRQLANLGLHIAPVVVELDLRWRDSLAMGDDLDQRIIERGEEIHRSSKNRCFSTFDLWECYAACMPVFRPISRMDVELRKMNRTRIDALESAICLAQVENITDGAALATVVVGISDLDPTSVIPPYDHRIIVDRMVERSGFCRYCADRAGTEVAAYITAQIAAEV